MNKVYFVAELPQESHPFKMRRNLFCIGKQVFDEKFPTIERLAQDLELPDNCVLNMFAEAGDTPLFSIGLKNNTRETRGYFLDGESAAKCAAKINERFEYNRNKLQVGKKYKFCAEDLAAVVVGEEFGEGTYGDYPCENEEFYMYVEGYKGQYRLYNNDKNVDIASEYTKQATVKSIDTEHDVVEVEFGETENIHPDTERIAKLSSFEARACLEPLEG